MKQRINQLRQLSWHKFDRVSPFILVILILYLCWKLAALFWWMVAPPQVMQFQSVQLGSKQAQIPNISSFSLFSEPSSVAVNDQRNYELQGVVIAYPSQLSSAVIKVDSDIQNYRVGQVIDNSDYTLSEVYWDHVILRQANGATKEVRFKGIDNGLYQPLGLNTTQAPANTANTNNNTAQSPNAAIGQAIEQMQQNHEQYLQNLGVASSGNGYEVSDRTPAALKSALGLRTGDRIVSVNGQPVGQGQNDLQLLEQVKREGKATIVIKRGDQMMTIEQNFK